MMFFRRRHDERGQALVEFGLALPILILLVIGLIEFAMAFNANLAVNFASREAALIAAESGNDSIADCRILQKIEQSIGSPARASRINQVRIYRAGVNGNELAANVYSRGGNMKCEFWDGVATQEITVNYTLLTGDIRPAAGATSSRAAAGRPSTPSAWPSATPTRGSPRSQDSSA